MIDKGDMKKQIGNTVASGSKEGLQEMQQEGVNAFINNAVTEDSTMFKEDAPAMSKPNKANTKFLQASMNALNKSISGQTGQGYTFLKEDGDYGPKTEEMLNTIMSALPRDMKRWAGSILRKGGPEIGEEGMKDTMKQLGNLGASGKYK